MIEETLEQWYEKLRTGNALDSIVGIIVVYVEPWMLEDSFALGCDDYIGMGADMEQFITLDFEDEVNAEHEEDSMWSMKVLDEEWPGDGCAYVAVFDEGR